MTETNYMNQPDNPQPQRKAELPPEGNNLGRLVWFIDLGTHDDSYEGKTTVKHKVMLGWELAAKMEDGRPFLVCEEHTISPSKFGGYYAAATSNLNKLIRNWKEVDEKVAGKLGKIGSEYMGTPAKLMIEHKVRAASKAKPRAELQTEDYKYNIIKASPCDCEPPALVNPTLVYAIGQPFPDHMPAFIKRKIEISHEMSGRSQPKPQSQTQPSAKGGFDDDIPF